MHIVALSNGDFSKKSAERNYALGRVLQDFLSPIPIYVEFCVYNLQIILLHTWAFP
jgi:hypothetical protein